MDEIRNNLAIPGIAVGVIQNDQITYLQGFGYEDLKTKEPVTPDTLFHAASISKVFTATAIMQLVILTYSDTNFDILGALISEVSGQSFEDYLAEKILKPMALNQARACATFGKPQLRH